jgi:hypothetical protein
MYVLIMVRNIIHYFMICFHFAYRNTIDKKLQLHETIGYKLRI